MCFSFKKHSLTIWNFGNEKKVDKTKLLASTHLLVVMSSFFWDWWYIFASNMSKNIIDFGLKLKIENGWKNFKHLCMFYIQCSSVIHSSILSRNLRNNTEITDKSSLAECALFRLLVNMEIYLGAYIESANGICFFLIETQL